MRKRILSLLLALCVIVGLLSAVEMPYAHAETEAAAEQVNAKPFYGLTWDSVDRSLFGNLENAPVMNVDIKNGVLTISGSSDFAAKAASMKTTMDALPEGMRYIRIFKSLNALKVAEDVIYADDGVAQLKNLVTQFIEAYYAIGGKLDGIILDTEYTAMHNWYIYRDVYHGNPDEGEVTNTNIYADIYNNPKFETEVRPLLEERGFVFHTPDTVSGKPERSSPLFSIWPIQYLGSFKTAYGNCQSIWNKVMANRIAAYMTDAVYEPMAERYPNATVSDYVVADTATWLGHVGNDGSTGIYAGNAWKAGNTSNFNMYNSGPNADFFKNDDGNYLYKNIQSHNEAVYADNAYNSLQFNVNRMRSAYSATDTKNISVWVAEYDYSGRNNSVKNSPYYTEYLYHIGLLDPKPFLVYMYRGASNFTGSAGLVVYNQRMKVISQALNELTRVAGYSDRKPIELPQGWNDSFMLSGMYANGRNIWRLTPDVTGNMTLDAFKVEGTDPTFSIDGNTVTFPGGKILADAAIDDVGSCGYWIETAKDVQPVITREADRYVKYPAYQENFDYSDGTIFNATNAKDVQGWEASADLLIENGALALTATADLNNVKIPKNITAGDGYAQKQVWEVSVTLPESMPTSSTSYVRLLAVDSNEGGFKLQQGAVYYGKKGLVSTSWTKIGVTLTVGQKYTLRREMDFAANKCTYSVLDTNGTLLKRVADVALNVTMPVSTIGMSSYGMTTKKVLVDDYKLYTNGLEHTIKFYDGDTGVYQTATEQLTTQKVAYRLSWMNATSKDASGHLCVARYDNSGKLVSNTALKNIQMKAGWDGVETGVLENATGKLTVYLRECDGTETELRNQKDTGCGIDGYTGDLVCTTCGEIVETGEVIYGTPHDKITIPGKAATCTEDGYTKYEYCSLCSATITPKEVILAGHKEQIYEAKAETCTEDGLTEGKWCTVCQQWIVPQDVIPAWGHTEVIIPGKAATCTEDGLTEGKYCSVCNEVLATQEVIPATGYIVTLWGNAYAIKVNEPAEFYWVNGADGENPVAATAEDNWNYSYALVDGVPTVTLRNATYSGAASFMTAQFDGKLKLIYEGTNNIKVSSGSGDRCFLSFKGATGHKSGASTRQMYIEGADGAVLNITGGDDATMLGVADKIYLNITGGTINIEKDANIGGVQAIIGAAYSKTTIKNCTLNVKGMTTTSGKHPAVTLGYSSGAVTITNSRINIETNAHVGLCVGVFQSNMKGVLYAGSLTIDENSHIKVVTDSNSTSTYTYNGVGIYAASMTVKSSFVEAEAKKQAVYGTVKLASYGGDYELFTAKGGEAVSEYAATTYFKVRRACDHANATTVKNTVNATCETAGSETTIVSCQCGEVFSETIVISALGHDWADADCNTAKTCKTCGATEGEALGHTEAEAVKENEVAATCGKAGSYDEVVYCSVCEAELSREKKTVAATGEHVYTETITKEATCKEEGVKTFTCGCGASYTEVIEKIAHTEKTTVETVDATCTTAGSVKATVTCESCGDTLSETTEEIKALGHTEEIIPGKAATCTETGLTEDKHCSVCGEVLVAQQVIPAKGHGYKEVVTAPDCVSGGYTTYTCACGDTYVGDYTEALGHTPKAAVKENEVANSCTKPGSYDEVIYCIVCDAELSRTPVAVDPAGHTPGEAKQENYTDSTCSAEGGYDLVVRCSECTAVISSQAEVVAKKTHTEEIIPAVAATCSGNGKTEGKKCSVCGEILKAQEEIPATGHVNTTEKVTTIDATCTTAGSKTTKVTCACGYVVSEIVEKIPATGHTYADDADKECNICNAVRATITKAYNKVTVNANDTTVRRVYVFNITGKTVDDINNWGQLQAADSNYWGTKKTEFALEDGTYVLRVEYYDANDVICADSYQIDINDEPKELQITTNENIVTVNVNNITFRRVYVFNITGKTVDDINNWGQLQAADSNYWGTKKTEFALEDGTYVLRVEYYDANDVICADSYQIDINYDPKELQITANKNTVTVNINNITFRRVYVFNITGKTVGDINNWGQLQAADANYWSTKKTEFALENGTYVLRVEYYDANDVICADSYQIEINYESKEPQIIVNENTVTVNNNGTTFRRVYVFNITGKTVGDINNWSQLQAADTNYWSTKKTEFILEEGTYVLCIEYYDVANNYCTYFEQVPIS